MAPIPGAGRRSPLEGNCRRSNSSREAKAIPESGATFSRCSGDIAPVPQLLSNFRRMLPQCVPGAARLAVHRKMAVLHETLEMFLERVAAYPCQRDHFTDGHAAMLPRAIDDLHG